jgi:transcription antitermination protein NusB
LAEIRESTILGERRRAREFALQLLFQLDLSPGDAGGAVDAFFRGKKIRAPIAEFAGRLVRGSFEHQGWIDDVLGTISHNWRVARMAVVDRNILRLALYEMLFEHETPPIVVINEAIEIAKKFGNDESGPFINGILDAVRLKIEGGEILPPDAAAAGGVPARVRTSA